MEGERIQELRARLDQMEHGGGGHIWEHEIRECLDEIERLRAEIAELKKREESE